eukprot:2167600-Amphidinium_carterae.1
MFQLGPVGHLPGNQVSSTFHQEELPKGSYQGGRGIYLLLAIQPTMRVMLLTSHDDNMYRMAST